MPVRNSAGESQYHVSPATAASKGSTGVSADNPTAILESGLKGGSTPLPDSTAGSVSQVNSPVAPVRQSY